MFFVQSRKSRAALALLTLSFSWGMQACITPIVQKEMQPLQQLSIQTLLAFAILAVFAMKGGKTSLLSAALPSRFMLMNIRALVGTVGVVLIFMAYTMAPVAHVVWVQAVPLVVLWGVLLSGEKLRLSQVFLLIISLCGVALMLDVRKEISWNSCSGELLALSGSALFALSLNMGSSLARELGVLNAGTWHMLLVAAYASLGALVQDGLNFNMSTTVLILTIAQGVLVAVNNQLCTYGFAYLSSGAAASITTLDVIWAPAFAYMIFGELPAQCAFLGGILIVGAALGMYVLPERLSPQECCGG